MSKLIATYIYANTHDAPTCSQGGVLACPRSTSLRAWLYWLRVWLGLCCDTGLEGMAREYAKAGYLPYTYERPAPVNNRARRRWAIHYRRCGSVIADEFTWLESLLPSGLSAGQRREYLCRISRMGRVRIYGLRRAHPLRHMRARLLQFYKQICSLHPP